MTIEELKQRLKKIQQQYPKDYENGHIEADKLLIEFINDPEVTKLYDMIGKWYA